MWRSALLLLLTAFPWGEAVNLRAMCAVITVASVSVGSSELSVTAEWATLAAEQPAAARPGSKLTGKQNNNLMLKQTTWSDNRERWIASSPRFVTLPKITAWKHFITEDCTTVNFPKILQGLLLIAFYFELLACIDICLLKWFYILLYFYTEIYECAASYLGIKCFMKPCTNKIIAITVLVFYLVSRLRGQHKVFNPGSWLEFPIKITSV